MHASIQEMFEQAKQHQQAGRLAAAEALFRQILEQDPKHADALHLLGVVLYQSGRAEQAVEHICRAIETDASRGDFHSNYGLVLANRGRTQEAIAAFREAVRLRPDLVQTWSNLAVVLESAAQREEAIAAYREALRLQPQATDLWFNLGLALGNTGRWEEAAAAYRQVLALQPNSAAAAYNLGYALRELKRLDESVAAYRQALAIQPDHPDASNNLAIALQDTGRLEEAVGVYRELLQRHPDFVWAHGNLLFMLNYMPQDDPQAVLQEHRKWNQQHARPLAGEIQPHANDRDPERRLRIGYVSPNFCQHCQSLFTIPLLSNHDRGQFEIYGYADVPQPDEFTQRLRGYFDVWRSTEGQSDAQIAQRVREDRIDLLVDLTMHGPGGRLLLFARQPAPVQVIGLAYPGTSGLETMDYRLSDPYHDPPENDAHYVEKTIRLPETYWCFDPLTPEPAVNALPALAAGHVTFGCLNNFWKINDRTLEMWAQVLAALPGSHLVLLAPQGTARQRVLEKLGVDAARIEFVKNQPRHKYLEVYHRIDLALDPFPYNGHTTSLDAMWMGVPVVSLCGRTAASRAGLSQASNLGLAEQLVGDTPQQYVRLAVKLAGDLPRLSELRQSLRDRMKRSPLMDGPRFARHVEAAYRRMWRSWCQKQG